MHGVGEPQLAPDGVPVGQQALDGLVGLLDLEQLEVNLFRGVSPPHRSIRVFGGQVAGQALVAAGRTVPEDRYVHSLHAYFIRPGDPRIPIVYEAERVRDGRSFTTRRVLGIQHGEAIFSLSASFQLTQRGIEHTEPVPDGVPDPESLPDLATLIARNGGDGGWGWAGAPRPLDLRFVEEPRWSTSRKGALQTPQRVWMRADGVLPEDHLLHQCMLTYASDLTLLGSVLARHEVTTDVTMASLDHAVWFHGPFRADEWLLYEVYSPVASGSRGLATGRFFRQDGTLVATTVQEGLVRVAGE